MSNEKYFVQGNQAIEVMKGDKILSQALDYHFTDDNCDGVLTWLGIDFKGQQDGYCDITLKCGKCGEVIRIRKIIEI